MRKNAGRCLGVLFAVSSFAPGASLQVEVAAVGGSIALSPPPGCTTYTSPPVIGSFATGVNIVPLGGIAPCGYSGNVLSLNAGSGPISLEQSVTANYTDSSVFQATARARADYGRLGLFLSGSRDGGSGGTDLTGASAVASHLESFVIDAAGLTGQSGSVRFLYTIDGALSNVSTTSGGANIQMRYLVNGLPSSGLTMFSANVVGTSLPFLPFAPEVDNWTVGAGSLSGSASYATSPIAFTFGNSVDFQLALLAFIYPFNGSSTVDFYSSATLSQIEVRNAQGQLVSGFSVTSGSGTLYGEDGLAGSPVPEPTTLLLTSPLALLLLCRKRRAQNWPTLVSSR